MVWASDGSSGSDSIYGSIQGQRFGADGAPIGDELQINTYTTDHQLLPAVAVNADRNFVVAWTSYGSSGSDSIYGSVQGQLFCSVGALVGAQFQVNSYTTSYQFLPAVAVDGAGDFVVVWTILPAVAVDGAGDFVVVWTSDGSSGSDSSDWSIQGQRFIRAVFADGFESGDTMAWSNTAPLSRRGVHLFEAELPELAPLT